MSFLGKKKAPAVKPASKKAKLVFVMPKKTKTGNRIDVLEAQVKWLMGIAQK